jgi:hypothetical protein
MTLEITAELTAEATSETTEVVIVESTAELTVETTEEATAELMVSITPTATPGSIPLIVKSAVIEYQNRESHEGIEVLITTLDGTLLSVAETNKDGVYSVPIPEDESFMLSAQAPLHRRLDIMIEAQAPLASLILVGGDMNADGCINQSDINIVLAYYEQEDTPQTDINADSITDLADLAILTGNYDGNCEPVLPELTTEPKATLVASTEPEATLVASTESKATLVETVPAEVTATIELTVELEETAEASP